MSSIPARLSSLPDDLLRALATFVPLSDLLVLVRCSLHFCKVLQRSLNGCLDRLYAVTHLKEHWAQARQLPFNCISDQPDKWVLEALFGEAERRAYSRGYCFVEVEGQCILGLRGNAPYYIFGKTKSARDRFASWLCYRCEQQLATEALDNSTEVISGATSDL
jgi:hypothetical protein